MIRVPTGFPRGIVHGRSYRLQAACDSSTLRKPKLSGVCFNYCICDRLNHESYHHNDTEQGKKNRENESF